MTDNSGNARRDMYNRAAITSSDDTHFSQQTDCASIGDDGGPEQTNQIFEISFNE